MVTGHPLALSAVPLTSVSGIEIVWQITMLLISIAVIAFFSSTESSLLSVNKVRMQHLLNQGNKAAQSVLRILGHHEKFFATILLSENIFIIFASSIGTAFSIKLLGESPYSIIIATVIITLLVVILGEITPKSLASRFSNTWSLVVARPIEAIMYLETPLIYAFTIIPKLVIKTLAKSKNLSDPSVTEGELRLLVSIARSEGMVETSEAEMIEKVFRFGDRQVQEIMTPRTRIIWIESGAVLKNFLSLYATSSHTRYPVFKDNTENVVGILSTKDVIRSLSRKEIKQTSIVTKLCTRPHFVPETKLISETFHDMRRQKQQLAMVVDEFGGVSGIVTLKQLAAEIVGPVEEEAEYYDFHKIDPITTSVPGESRITDINKRLDINLPEGKYETIAGLLLEYFGHIPRENEQISIENVHLTIKKIQGVRIREVAITKSYPNPIK